MPEREGSAATLEPQAEITAPVEVAETVEPVVNPEPVAPVVALQPEARRNPFVWVRDKIRERRERPAKEAAARRESLKTAKAGHEDHLNVIQQEREAIEEQLALENDPNARKELQAHLDHLAAERDKESAVYARNILDRMLDGEKITENELMTLALDAATNVEKSALAELYINQQGFKTFQEAMGKLGVKSARHEDLIVRRLKGSGNEWINEHIKKLGVNTAAGLTFALIFGGPISWAGLGGSIIGGGLARLGGEWWRHRQISKDGLGEKMTADLLGTVYLMQAEAKKALEAAGNDESARIAALGNLLTTAASSEAAHLKEYQSLERKATKVKAIAGLIGATTGSLVGTFLARGAEGAQILGEAKAHGQRIFHDASGGAHLTADQSAGHEVYETNKGVWRFMLEKKDIAEAQAIKGPGYFWQDWLHYLSPTGQELPVPSSIGSEVLLHAGKEVAENQSASLLAAIQEATLFKALEVSAAMAGAAAITETGFGVASHVSAKRLRDHNEPLIDILEAEAVRVVKRSHPDANSFEARNAAYQQTLYVEQSLTPGTIMEVNGEPMRVIRTEAQPDNTLRAVVEPIQAEPERQAIASELLSRMHHEIEEERTSKKFGREPIGPIDGPVVVSLFQEFQQVFDSLEQSKKQATGLNFEQTVSPGTTVLAVTDNESGSRFSIVQTNEGHRFYITEAGGEPEELQSRKEIIDALRVIDRKVHISESGEFTTAEAGEEEATEPNEAPQLYGGDEHYRLAHEMENQQAAPGEQMSTDQENELLLQAFARLEDAERQQPKADTRVKKFEGLYIGLSHFASTRLAEAGITLESYGVDHYVDSIVYTDQEGRRSVLSLPRGLKEEPKVAEMKLTVIPPESGDNSQAVKVVKYNPTQEEVNHFFRLVVDHFTKYLREEESKETETNTVSREVVPHADQSGTINEQPEKPKRGVYLPERVRENELPFKVNERVRGLINTIHERQRQQHLTVPDARAIVHSGEPDPDHTPDYEAEIAKLQSKKAEDLPATKESPPAEPESPIKEEAKPANNSLESSLTAAGLSPETFSPGQSIELYNFSKGDRMVLQESIKSDLDIGGGMKGVELQIIDSEPIRDDEGVITDAVVTIGYENKSARLVPGEGMLTTQVLASQLISMIRGPKK